MPTVCNLIGRRLMFVALVFVLVVLVVIGLNRHLLVTVNPLDSPALRQLVEQLDSDPGNVSLRQHVRELDLLARRAFLIRQWQIETGAYLLVGGLTVLLISLWCAIAGQRHTPDVARCPGSNDPWRDATLARRVVMGTSLAILVLAALVAMPFARSVRLRTESSPRYPDGGRADADASVYAAVPADRSRAGPAEPVTVALPATARGDVLAPYWPSFRGSCGLGVAADATPPTEWNGVSGKGLLWKVPVPRGGFSSPVVWGDRLFLTGADETAREVYCFDADTGALIWTADTRDVPGYPSELPRVIEDTGYAAPSVATDGRRVAAIFATGVMLGLDTDGRRLWSRVLPVPVNHYGHASSLLLRDGLLYVQIDHFGGSEVMALDVETGHPIWVQSREADISWASPILIEHAGRRLLVLNAAPMVSAYDALTGEERWRNDCMHGEIGSSPAFAAGRVFAANIYASAVALDAADGTLLWETKSVELPDAASPVATARHLFLPTGYGVFTCLDATDGRMVWEHEFDRGGFGSPVLAAGRIYWVTEDGVTRIFKADDPFELIAEPALGEPSVSTPAIVGKRIFIRGTRYLYAIEE